jgi:hypothetical protein
LPNMARTIKDGLVSLHAALYAGYRNHQIIQNVYGLKSSAGAGSR